MTSRGSKKAFSVFFRFTLEIPFQIRDSAIPSAIPRSRKLTGTTYMFVWDLSELLLGTLTDVRRTLH